MARVIEMARDIAFKELLTESERDACLELAEKHLQLVEKRQNPFIGSDDPLTAKELIN